MGDIKGWMDDMSKIHLREVETPETGFLNLDFGTLANHPRGSPRSSGTESVLLQALADKDAQLGERDEQLRQQENLSREFDHRLMNSLQMIVSLLSLQSRTTDNAEAAAQLRGAANRVTMIVRVHRRLHSFDDIKVLAFRKYVEDLCGDFATMMSPQGSPECAIVVEGAEFMLPADTGIPLGFIVCELITNAAKHGTGPIFVRLETNPGKGYVLSVSNSGSVLPEGFDPARSKGLGMKIIRSFVEKIGGELRFGRGDDNEGTRFTVLFA